MKDWIPLKASRQSLGVSHLFFANNLMLFAKANKAGAESIKKVLSIFCKEFGQLVSVEKSCIYFSSNVPPNIREDICGVIDIAKTSNLGKYLGFPLNHKGAARNSTTLLSKGLSLSYRGGNLNSYPLLEERFLSNLSWLKFQIMLCRGLLC